MRIGVIGAGRLGGTLAAWAAESGHDVAVSSRHPERLLDLGDRTHTHLRVMPPVRAADFGEVVLFAPTWAGAREAVGTTHDALAGKVVIDATNPAEAAPPGHSGMEALIELAPEAHWVKGLNTVPADVLSRRRGHDPLLAEFVCTDHTDARLAASRIIRDLGFAPVFAGGAEAARLTETGGPLQHREVDVQDATDVLAEALSALR